MSIRVVAPGAFTTVQDLGRPGWAAAGVGPSGAFDPFALRAANLLVGNDPGAAGLEITLQGPTIACDRDLVVAIVGAAFEIAAGTTSVPSAGSFTIPAGVALRVGKATGGVRAWMAVRGGVDVPPMLGSRSTHASAGIGGVAGRALIAGDVLPVGPSPAVAGMPQALPAVPPSGAGAVAKLRAVPGPHADAFTRRGETIFYESTFPVSPRADRVGVRLDGLRIEHASEADIDPEGVVTGAVQVPGDGAPIVLGPDRPATGGYATIATVITADLPILAQARPGDTLRFAAVTADEAREALRAREVAFRSAFEGMP